MIEDSESFRAGMTFRDRIEKFKHDLDRWPALDGGEADPLVDVAWEIVSAVEDGQVPLTVAGRVLDAFDKAERRWTEAFDQRRKRLESDYAEAVRRHDVAVTADCPFCGMPAGKDCVTAGPSGAAHRKGIHDHRDRYRAALRVLGGSPDPGGPADGLI